MKSVKKFPLRWKHFSKLSEKNVTYFLKQQNKIERTFPKCRLRVWCSETIIIGYKNVI